MFEDVPGRGVGPLHLVEEEDERTLLRHQPDVLAHLIEETILAPPRRGRRGRIRPDGAHEVMELSPRTRRSTGQPVQGSDERSPHAVRLPYPLLPRPTDHER